MGILYADAHCHLNLFDDPKRAVADSLAAGVDTILATGGSAKDNPQVVSLADGKNVFGVIGIDPTFADKDATAIDGLEALVKGNKSVVGIGEIGLDMVVPTASLDVQHDVFEKQLEIAMRLDKPVVLHARKAIDDLLTTIIEMDVERAMLHFFEGDEVQAKLAEKHGYMVSISPGDSSRKKRVIKAVDITSIVTETDSPIVGKSPVDVVKVAETIAKLKGIGVAEAAEQTRKNVREFFYI